MNLIESKIDTKRIYFHGSAEPKTEKWMPPSTKHPFYVTSDLHYAMVFCSKAGSNTGLWDDRDIKSTELNNTFVYVFSLNDNAKFFDFRNYYSTEFKDLFKIIPESLVRKCLDNMDDAEGDFYIFCSDMSDTYLGKPAAYNSYDEYAAAEDNEDMMLSSEEYDLAKETINKLGLKSNDFQTHVFMSKILDRLKKLGYSGFISTESDNDENTWDIVSTSYAVGIFDIKGIDFASAIPMKYKWLKKINPKYLKNITGKDCREKIDRYVEIYQKMTLNKGK